MSLIISTTPTTTTTFDPAAQTLNFNAWTNPVFELQKIVAVYNKTVDKFIYRIGDSAFGYTAFAANIMTLAFDTTAQSASDVLEIHYGEDYVIQDQTLIGQAAQTAIVNNILTPIAGAGSFEKSGYRSAMVQVVSTGTGGTFIFEGSNNNINFQTIPVYNQLLTTGVPIVAAITASATQIGYYFPVNFRYIRLRIVSTITGGSIQAFSTFSQQGFTPFAQQVANNTAASLATTATIASGTVTTVTTLANGQTAHSSPVTGSPVRIGFKTATVLDVANANGDAGDVIGTTAGQLVIKPYGTAENDWQFATGAGGITTTADFTLRAAGAAQIKNYCTAISVVNASATIATEVVIKDGANVIWRGYVGAGTLLNSSVGINFPTPLKGSAATGLNVACITAGSQVYVNAQGYQSF